jgi:hypothetical protein
LLTAVSEETVEEPTAHRATRGFATNARAPPHAQVAPAGLPPPPARRSKCNSSSQLQVTSQEPGRPSLFDQNELDWQLNSTLCPAALVGCIRCARDLSRFAKTCRHMEYFVRITIFATRSPRLTYATIIVCSPQRRPMAIFRPLPIITQSSQSTPLTVHRHPTTTTKPSQNSAWRRRSWPLRNVDWSAHNSRTIESADCSGPCRRQGRLAL